MEESSRDRSSRASPLPAHRPRLQQPATGILATPPGRRSTYRADRACLEQSTVDNARRAVRQAGLRRKGRFEIGHVDLSAAVHETTSLIRASIGRTVRLELQLSMGLPIVEGDLTQIRQIIMNLVLNGAEATEGKAGVIRVTTGVMDAAAAYLASTHLSPDLPEGRYVFLEVADNGRGMSPDTLARIFDPFFSTKFTGRGLGLAAVLGIVRAHNGALKVEATGLARRSSAPAASNVLATRRRRWSSRPRSGTAAAWPWSSMTSLRCGTWRRACWCRWASTSKPPRAAPKRSRSWASGRARSRSSCST